MTKMGRVRSFLGGFSMILIGIFMIAKPVLGFAIAILILSITLIVRGAGYIIYYFTMARHMVGGKSLLFPGIIMLDLGVFTFSMSNVPTVYFALYLIGAYVFDGGIDIMRALESKRYEASSWKLKFSGGLVNIAIAVLALISGIILGSLNTVVYIYGAGVIYSGIMKIAGSFRRTAIVYIQ